jgi:death-on-curing protein
MSQIIWLKRELVEGLHQKIIQRSGGSTGVLNTSGLESALMKPQNLNYYDGMTNLYVLAACYAYGLVKNHCFMDGNKRIGFIAALTFLDINFITIDPPEDEATRKFLELAQTTLPQEDVINNLAEWFRQYLN